MHAIQIEDWQLDNRQVCVTVDGRPIRVWAGMKRGMFSKAEVNAPSFNGGWRETYAYANAIQAASKIADYINLYTLNVGRQLIERMPGFERS